MTKVINLTPHTVNLVQEVNGEYIPLIDFPASGELCRVTQSTERIGTLSIDGIEVPTSASTFGEVTGLPDPQEDTVYIVSLAVINALKKQGVERWDLYIPNESVRNDKGQIVGCKSLALGMT